MEDVRMEVRRLSRCLSDGCLLSSGSSQADGDLGEQANLQTVTDIQLFSSNHETILQLNFVFYVFVIILI